MEVAGAGEAYDLLGGGSQADTDRGQIGSLIAGREAPAARIRARVVISCRGLIASGISGAASRGAQPSTPGTPGSGWSTGHR
jgi:hypothetical protein